MNLDVHVVTHTHWDREWYHPFERFQQRLVPLVDEVLADPPRDASFLLDGQAIVLEDYLAVRPQREPEVRRLLSRGRLEAGPWYVLPDELIPSGEALVRNLLAGRAVLARLGATSPPVLYCPDSFGHPAALPELAAGFGLPLAIVWRGYGGSRWPAGDAARWNAPSGAGVTLFHLPRSGYEHGSALPWQPEQAADRWQRMRDELATRSSTGVLLVLNGADHHALQPRLPEALASLVVAALPDVVRRSSLTAFARAFLARVGVLPAVAGELRDSYGYTWTLGGTLASRAHQKRQNARAERVLVREAEPWSALVALSGGTSRQPLLSAAWRAVLTTHPHDTLCGCCIDQVARAMDARQEGAIAQAEGIREDSMAEWLGHDAAAARERIAEWNPVLVVRNAAARRRGGVARVEIIEPIAIVPVGCGSAGAAKTLDAAATAIELPGVQRLSVATQYRRTESPRHYPMNERVRRTDALVWMRPVAGFGTLSIPISELRGDDSPAPVRAADREMANGVLAVRVAESGDVEVSHLATRHTIGSLILLEDQTDGGDLYTPSLRGDARSLQCTGIEQTQNGPLRVEFRIRMSGESPGSGSIALDIFVSLDAGAEFVRVRVAGMNAGADHRLRIGFQTGLQDAEVWADAAFGPVRREAVSVAPEDARMELPLRTAPLQRYVSLFTSDGGATVFSDGLAEYEATQDGTVFVTLLRAVGELSRNDLPERPGHAGWPTPTPGAQCPGPFGAELAFMLHGPRSAGTVVRIEHAAEDVLLPLAGHTIRDAIHTPAPTMGGELEGEGLALLAIKPCEDRLGVALRCVNLLDSPGKGRWHLGPHFATAWRARLDETPGDALPVEGNAVSFGFGPREVVTIIAGPRATTPHSTRRR